MRDVFVNIFRGVGAVIATIVILLYIAAYRYDRRMEKIVDIENERRMHADMVKYRDEIDGMINNSSGREYHYEITPQLKNKIKEIIDETLDHQKKHESHVSKLTERLVFGMLFGFLSGSLINSESAVRSSVTMGLISTTVAGVSFYL